MTTTAWGTFSADLTPTEAIMWKGEDQARLRSGGILLLLLDRAPEWSRLVRSFEYLSRQFPRFRQRIVSTPFSLSHPRWVIDASFDLSTQLRRVALPDPGTMEQLLAVIEQDATAGFDTLRPPWQGMLIEGLEDGRAALALHNHHALFDGRGMIDVLERWFDRERDAPEPPMAPEPHGQHPDEIELLRQALGPRKLLRIPRRVSHLAASAVRSARHPHRAVSNLVEVADVLKSIAAAPIGPRSDLFAVTGNAAHLAMLTVAFPQLRAAAKSVDGSLNDALLAVVSGALGRYHEKLGAPVETVNLAFPISIRTEDDDIGGNRFAGATIAAPTRVGDPAARVHDIRDQVLDAREAIGPDVLEPLSAVLYRLPSWLIAAIPLMEKIDAQVSNFPGLRFRHYLAGAEVLGSYGFGPHPGTPLMVVLITHVDTCCIAVNADASAVTDLPLLIACMQETLDEMLALADHTQASSSSRAASRAGTDQQ